MLFILILILLLTSFGLIYFEFEFNHFVCERKKKPLKITVRLSVKNQNDRILRSKQNVFTHESMIQWGEFCYWNRFIRLLLKIRFYENQNIQINILTIITHKIKCSIQLHQNLARVHSGEFDVNVFHDISPIHKLKIEIRVD